MQDFMELVGKDECCIPHEMLVKYKVLTLEKGTTDVKRLLDQYEFLEGTSYVRNVAEVDSGRTDKNLYILHTDAFKKILIRSKNTYKYADYYLLLEKCIKYYNDYQVLRLKGIIIENNKIKLLSLENRPTLDNFIIVRTDKYKNYPYATVKGSKENVRMVFRDENFNNEDIILSLQVPSQSNFNKKIKEVLKLKFSNKEFIVLQKKYKRCNDGLVFYGDEDHFDYEKYEYVLSCTRYFNILGISEIDFLKQVHEINESRFDY